MLETHLFIKTYILLIRIRKLKFSYSNHKLLINMFYANSFYVLMIKFLIFKIKISSQTECKTFVYQKILEPMIKY